MQPASLTDLGLMAKVWAAQVPADLEVSDLDVVVVRVVAVPLGQFQQ